MQGNYCLQQQNRSLNAVTVGTENSISNFENSQTRLFQGCAQRARELTHKQMQLGKP